MDVAIVGMAGRFPGAPDVDTLWRRVAAGDDCLDDLDVEELVASGVPRDVARSTSYVKRAGVLDDVEGFDHDLFGIGARDGAVMDPQHRHFLECSWEALESAAIVPDRFDGSIGVFGGCGMNTYLLNNLLTNGKVLPQLGWFLLRHTGNDKDFLTNNVAYRLDLHGPAVNVQTACSTSLVAVHLAVQSLLAFETDVALAGGATIESPHRHGYEYHEGEILAPDGVCRAFDARSAGTVLTSGVAVVALRRLADAIAQGDPILAVIKGTAINNDGARKVGFLAPSVDGHADVIREALSVAGLSARDLQLFEAHGTGTAVGDPIEIAAASEAFRTWTQDHGFCRVVSTKPNIGHLDTAAGGASLIKVVQALRHTTLPPLANHTAPSPLVDLERSPFYLSATADPWPGDAPRRAGISSLGVGGTNAHVVVQEAPPLDTGPPSLPDQALVLSARTAAAVDDAAGRLADHLEAEPGLELADVARTLFDGRRHMEHRRIVVATDVESAIHQLREPDRYRTSNAVSPAGGVRLGFMFPGGGSQYAAMGAGLDARFETFHAARRDGIELVRQFGGPDLEPLLTATGDVTALQRASASLPAVFVTSVALARQWMELGARPDVLLGHSLGEYTAAHLAGVMSFEDAVRLVVIRSALMERESGTAAAMLAVPLPEADVQAVLPATLDIAAVNADDECVVAGPLADITALAATLEGRGISATLLPLSAAAHSSMLDPMLDELHDAVRSVTLSAPAIPYPSNHTGTWITAEQATDPGYWVRHTRGTIRFADCLRTAIAGAPLVLTELGPGQSLSSFARRADPKPHAVIPSLRHPAHDIADTAFTMQAFGRQWAAGVDVSVAPFAGDRPRRLRLPTYPFQHVRCWIEPGTASATATAPDASIGSDARPARIEDLDRAIWTAPWVTAPRPLQPTATAGRWIVVGDDADDLVTSLVDELRSRGLEVHPTASAASALVGDTVTGVAVVAPGGGDAYAEAKRRWFDDTTNLLRALGSAAGDTRLVAVLRNALPVTGTSERPADAMALGVALVAPREYPNVATRVVDIDDVAAISDVVDDVLGEGPRVVAHRAGARSTPNVVPTVVECPPERVTFRTSGTYLVTGALGGVGHALATHLATEHQANLVIVSSSEVPEGAARTRWLATHAFDDPTSRRIRQLAALEQLGTKVVVVVADMADPVSISRALDDAERQIGHIDGAIHAAGRLHDTLVEMATPADHEIVLGAKARGALVLVEELARRGTELLVLVSSTSTIVAPAGQSSYVGANSVLDALAGRHGQLRVATLNFGLWAEVGVASTIARRARLGIEEGVPVDHPVLSERHVDRHGTNVFVGRLDPNHHWVLDEHRTKHGDAVYPGTGHLHLMMSALALSGVDDVELADVTLLTPLVVPDDTLVTVRVEVTADGIVEISSDGGDGATWELHSQATTRPLTDVAGRGDPRAELAQLGACERDLLAGQHEHVDFGARWTSVVVDARCGDDVVVAHLALPPDVAAEADRWNPHPALLDVATAVGVALAPVAADPPLYLPTGYRRVRSVGPLPPDVLVRATTGGASTPGRLEVDLDLFDADGVPVMTIEGLQLLASTGSTLQQRPSHDVVTPGPEAPNLANLADDLGLRPHEGAALLERLVGGDLDRIIGSTISIEGLLHTVEQGADADDPAPAATGAATLERALATMWSDLLGLDEVGPDDDFFDLGGHSLIAIRLMTRIHSELGVRLQLTTIFEAPTIATLSARLRADRPDIDNVFTPTTTPDLVPAAAPSGMTRHLVAISTRGSGRPLYVVHGAGGNILFLAHFGRSMAASRPVYGFQAHGVEGDDVPDDTVTAMATRYVTELREHGPGPYLLGGYSGGGIIALEMTKLLQASGETVDAVVLFDSPVGRISLGRRVHARLLLRNMIKHGPGVAVPIIMSRLQGTQWGRRLFFRGRTSIHQASHERIYEDTLAHGFHDLYDHFDRVVEGYEVGTYEVDAILIKAQLRWPLMPADYGWRDRIRGHLDVRIAPGDHESMFHGANVEELVAELIPLLDERTGEDDSSAG
jgi:acyl transferase domain-containing protein/thioesterase domain-containing protein/acyl carrier protein